MEFQEGDVYLNGEKLEENYVKGRTYPGITENPFTVHEGQLYVMGDNRENSLDSRDLGPIARTSIEGRAVFRIWPLPQFGSLSE
ncbi:Signal peptidase IB [compost metagenome]